LQGKLYIAGYGNVGQNKIKDQIIELIDFVVTQANGICRNDIWLVIIKPNVKREITKTAIILIFKTLGF
jgi:hypothetical protein